MALSHGQKEYYGDERKNHRTSWKWLKNQTNRLRRRLWKQRGEDAPAKKRELLKDWS